GKTAFVQHGCWQCHGFQGQGGVTGPKLAPEPIAAEAFVAFLRASNRAMPPYPEAILSNEDVADIHAYLESIPKPKDHKSIPLLAGTADAELAGIIDVHAGIEQHLQDALAFGNDELLARARQLDGEAAGLGCLLLRGEILDVDLLARPIGGGGLERLEHRRRP